MAAGKRDDPVTAFNFTVSLLESASPAAGVTTLALNTLTNNIEGGFNECSGLDATLEVEDYKASGVNDRVLKFPTRMSWGKLVLKKGIVKDMSLWHWIADFAEGKVQRRDGLIALLDARREAHTVWKFHRGLPVKYTGPRLAAAENAVAFESIEIEHEGLELMDGASGLASAIKGAAEGIASLF
jgi:phage tail-like protein